MPQPKENNLSGARDRILSRLRKAGRPLDLSQKPAGPFVTESGLSLTCQFEENIRLVNGIFKHVSGWDQAISYINNLAVTHGWRRISCPDPVIGGRLLNINAELEISHLEMSHCEAIITGCEALIAETGSILVSSAGPAGRKAFVSGDTHIVVAFPGQLFQDLRSAFDFLLGRYENEIPSMISVITGPSRTADIEKTLILGAHGPKLLYVLILEDETN